MSDADLNTSFEVTQLLGIGKTTLKNCIDYLQRVYAGHVGLEFGHITDTKKIEWLINETEMTLQAQVPLEQKKRILQKLNEGVMFEKFLHTKYIGQKRGNSYDITC